MDKLIAFDWDGTLADSTHAIVDSMRTAIEYLGLAQKEDKELRSIIGLGMHEAIAALYPNQDIDVDGLINAYRQRWLKSAAASTQAALFPNALPVVQGFAEQGYLVTVATGKSRAGLDRALRDTGLGRWVVDSRCADETVSKPAPDMLLELMSQFNVTPENTIMIGDTTFDLDMAAAAGVRSIATTFGAHDVPLLRTRSPEAFIDDLNELPALIEQLLGLPQT